MTVQIPRVRRRYRRLTVQLDVEYQVGADVWKAQATTLGAGGLFITTRNPFDAGTRLRVQFRVPGFESEHDMEARVVWCHAPGDDPPGQTLGMGIAFDHPFHILGKPSRLEQQ